MTNTEIKKELYKQKPEARLRFIRMGVAYYNAYLEDFEVNFEIPIEDMGNTDFMPTMDAKLLNRWITETPLEK